MIINFTVGNYRSFKDKKVLSMEATAIKELNESVIEKEGYRQIKNFPFLIKSRNSQRTIIF